MKNQKWSGVMRRNYSGYEIKNRATVLQELSKRGFNPLYERTILDHITYQYPDDRVAPQIISAEIVGEVHDDGVQAVVVKINGSWTRPDGKIFHITYSLGNGHKPAESNILIKRTGVKNINIINPPIELTVEAF